MCGIVGILDLGNSNSVTENRINKMRDLIEYRGPDDKDSYKDQNIAMGHRRLSIIDLRSGHQPMQTKDERYVIVFNGEIYNYRELRGNLEKKGYDFRTLSDTEVILNLYVDAGEDCVNYLNGIFGFAIWDKQQKRLFLARDHLGVKPIYYYLGSDSFVFSSEAKAIFESGLIEANYNIEAIPEYFIFRHVAGDRTLFKNIKVLLPGHRMTIENWQVTTQQYWSALNTTVNKHLSFEDAIEQLSEILQDAVKMQMVSDVPLGTFCSGGIDSSLITAFSSQNVDKPINTFCVGFNEQEYDETNYARMVSEKYGTDHHELIVTNSEFTDLIPKMIWHNDEPLNFPNSVQIYAISKIAKEFVTVVLTGEGSDEIFGGYPRYHISRYFDRIKLMPRPIRSMLGGLLAKSRDHRLRRLASYLNRSIKEVHVLNNAQVEMRWINRLMQKGIEELFPYRNEILASAETGGGGALRSVTMLDQHSYLLSLLNRQDKMSMAASIESRVPILDYRVVDFANSLPDKFKQRGTQTKYILKKLAERYLPMEVVYRKKSGFGVPLDSWFRGDSGLGEMAKDILVNKNFEELGDNIDIQAAFADHLSGQANNGEFLWTALNYGIWKKEFGIS